MDDFRSQLTTVLDQMIERGERPAFLVVDLEGAAEIKQSHGQESLDKFKNAAIDALVAATNGADAFTYGEDRVVAILGHEWDRLKTFALIQKLRRAIPLLGQSFDCYLRPEFDVIEYEASAGVAGLIRQITNKRSDAQQAAV